MVLHCQQGLLDGLVVKSPVLRRKRWLTCAYITYHVGIDCSHNISTAVVRAFLEARPDGVWFVVGFWRRMGDAAAGSPCTAEGDAEGARTLMRTFAACTKNGSRFAVRNALPKLLAIAESFPSEMDAALIRIAQALLEGVDGGGPKAPSGSADAAELLADLAVDSKHCLALLPFTLRLMGLASGVAPKSKHVRHCCALILARLLTEAPPSTGRSQQAAFLQLALDKFAPIRLVTLPGLAALGTAQTIATLVEMGCSDPVAKIRQEALVQVEMLQAEHALQLERHLWEALLDRSMDVSAAVRAQLFSLLSKAHPTTNVKFSLALRQGLEDTTLAVRRTCESMLQGLARNSNSSTTSSLLSFVGQLLVSSSDPVFNELSAEKALRSLLASADWCVIAEASMTSLLHGESVLSPEEAVVGRVALALDAEVWSMERSVEQCPGVLRKTLQALDKGDEFMLRQLLLVLLHSDVRCEDKSLLHVATATLLRAPVKLLDAFQTMLAFPQDSVQRSCRSTFHLAVLLARHSLGLSSRVGSKANGRREGRFTESMVTVLNVLQTKATAGFEDFKDEGISALAEHGRAQQSLAKQLAEQLDGIRSARGRFVNVKDYVSACSLQKDLNGLQGKYEVAKTAAEVIFAELEQHLSRILSVVEAILAHTQADLSEDYHLFLLMEDLLHPALTIADSAPPVGSWPSVRALAVRCIALYASLSPETSGQHWNFFKSVLESHIPEVSTQNLRYSVGDPTASEKIIFSCVAFMTDALTLHGTSEFEGQDSTGICQAVATLLAGGSHISAWLRQAVAFRMCTLMVFHGTQLDSAHYWVATWLLVQAFAQVESPLSGNFALEASVFSGRLLRFFASLRSLSSHHLKVLAAAAEGFLFCDLWRLGHLLPVVNQLPTVLALPRLVRFLSRELSVCSGHEEEENPWLQSLWRPLALVCLESTASVAGDANLPEALLVAITAADADEFRFIQEDQRAAVAAEVAWVINRTVEKWGAWNRSRSAARASQGEGLEKSAMSRLRERLASSFSVDSRTQGDWQSIYEETAQRRSRLREEITHHGVDLSRFLQDLGHDGGVKSGKGRASEYRGHAAKKQKLS
eukprot:s1760_g3.t2